ncbi:uncharacterized protein FOMMEDRAFT_157732 [Fomitiporia mediterranea MF3/22]|uniref:uncharacterized protein n=1 Tax=Fomitiporia mediterranea (strain MF3/22) TaxID=694068 RepID=UPI0004407863|nr:uncharacterized protein FOMMEDRAFT_157732 [Fomitiporia mediterranea MF3/22]EJD02509.1 hypothetical protein FOMMEDRAFT_157732 [Fomitiporia mediterranea MF3/22]
MSEAGRRRSVSTRDRSLQSGLDIESEYTGILRRIDEYLEREERKDEERRTIESILKMSEARLIRHNITRSLLGEATTKDLKECLDEMIKRCEPEQVPKLNKVLDEISGMISETSKVKGDFSYWRGLWAKQKAKNGSDRTATEKLVREMKEKFKEYSQERI